MRLLVTGAAGYVGSRVAALAADLGHEVVGASRSAGMPLDVTDRAATEDLVDRVRPDAIVHCAYRQGDWATTATGAAHVAGGAATSGARLVLVSTDLVFSGTKDRYLESDPPDPICAYGAAKAAAETVVAQVCPSYAVVRSSLVLGEGDSAPEQFVHRLAHAQARGALYTDEVRCPVHVDDLAAALVEVAVGEAHEHVGVLHVAGSEAVTRYRIGELVAARDGLDPLTIPGGPRGAAPGPAEVVLDTERTQALLRTRLRPVSEFLR